MNSPCTKTQLLLTEYSGGELSSAQIERVDSHLAVCADCREELKNEQRLRALLGDLPAQVFSGENSAPGSTRGIGRRILFVAGLAAVLLLAFLVDGIRDPNLAPGPEGPVASIAITPPWSRSELDTAQDELAYSLALTARLIKKSERSAVQQVFGEQIPHVISGSLNKAITTNQGDQG